MKITKIMNLIQLEQITKNSFQVKKFNLHNYSQMYNKYRFNILMNKGNLI